MGTKPKWKPRLKSYRVYLLLTGRTIYMDTFHATAQSDAINQCVVAIPHSGDCGGTLIAEEVES